MQTHSKESLIRKISQLEKRLAYYRNKLSEARGEIKNLLKTIKQHELILREFPGWLALIQDDRILLANKKVLEDLGYDETEVLGKSFEQFVHQDCLDYVLKIHRKRLMGKVAPDIYDLYLLSKSGQKVPSEVRVGKIRYQGRKAFLAALSPLQHQNEAEQSQIEEDKHRILSELSIGLAKELETSLNTLNNYLNHPDIQAPAQKDLFTQLYSVQKRCQEFHDLLKLLEDKSCSLMLPNAKTLPKMPPPGKVLKHKNVMILGEDDALIGLISEVLSQKGAMVIVPSNLSKTLKLLTKRKVDLVIADLGDSNVKLFGFLKKILDTFPGLPILCITSYGQKKMEGGLMGEIRTSKRIITVARPVNIPDLLNTVARQLSFGFESL